MRFPSIILVFLCLICSAIAPAQHTLNLPPRPSGAPTGSQFYQQIVSLTDAQREAAIITQIASGNIPDFLRTLTPIPVNATISGTPRTATYWVTPDYMAIGSDSDFFRMPMSGPLAQQVADLLGCNLPTRKMVNDIWSASAVKLSPQPFSPDTYDIDSVEVFWLSQGAIEQSRAGRTGLISGIKKDVVVTSLLPQRPPPPRVAIFGWHYTSGTPIQPLSLVHEATYEDYSHGIRLVDLSMIVDGAPAQVPDVIASATLNPLLSDEGSFTSTRYPNATTYPTPVPGTTPPPTTTAPPTATPVPSPLVNGSFENFDANNILALGWITWKTDASNTITYGRATVNHVDGSYSQYWSRSGSALFDGGVYQIVATEPGATYEFKGMIKRQSTYGGTFMMLGYDTTGGTDGASASVAYTDLTGTTDNVWVPYEASFRATGAATTLFARGGHSETTGTGNPLFYVDAITFRKTAEPPPATDGWMLR